MDWDDTSDSDKEVNYALMVNVESSSQTFEIKVPHSILAFDTDDTAELRIFLENMDVSFRDQTFENDRIKSECHNCGNTNNLAIYYMRNKDINSVAPS